MKKSISIISVLIVALLSFTLSAQSLIGTWEGVSTRTSGPLNGEIKFIQTFNSDNTGVINFDGYANGQLNHDSQMSVKIRGTFPFTWTRDGSTIVMIVSKSGFNLDTNENDLEFICKDPNMQAKLNAYKPQMIEMFRSQLKESLGSTISDESIWSNVRIEGDKMYCTEKGVDHTLTRVK